MVLQLVKPKSRRRQKPPPIIISPTVLSSPPLILLHSFQFTGKNDFVHCNSHSHHSTLQMPLGSMPYSSKALFNSLDEGFFLLDVTTFVSVNPFLILPEPRSLFALPVIQLLIIIRIKLCAYSFQDFRLTP